MWNDVLLQRLLLFLSITTLPTTKDLSCSNWPPPVWINQSYSVTMEMIVMSQAAASLRGGWEAIPDTLLIPSSLVINSWEHNRFQGYRAFKWAWITAVILRLLLQKWWWKRCNITTFLKLLSLPCLLLSSLTWNKYMAGSPKSPVIAVLLHLSPVNNQLWCYKPEYPLGCIPVTPGQVPAPVAEYQVYWACLSSPAISQRGWCVTRVAAWGMLWGLLPFQHFWGSCFHCGNN